jgi:methionyl-tRNA formyltransferase
MAAREVGGAVLRRFTGMGAPPRGDSLSRIARRHRVPLVAPPGGDVNHPRFVRRLAGELGATLALSVGCLPIFRAPLLSAFAMGVNYHDGAVPAYRGLSATAWSLYRGERESGFTFHVMIERVDAGYVLVEGTVPILPGQTGADLQRAKTIAAAASMPEVLARMAARDPGRPQASGGEYFGLRRRQALTRIVDPSQVTWDELQARLRAFGRLRLTLGARQWDVTDVRLLDGGERAALSFVTHDGIRAAPLRFMDLPRWLYLATRPFAALIG